MPARSVKAPTCAISKTTPRGVAITGGRIAGFAALDVAGATVWALFVEPAAERLGIGRALLKQMIAAAIARHLARLELTTSPGTRAEAFYRVAGWVPLEITGTGEVRMVRDLGPLSA